VVERAVELVEAVDGRQMLVAVAEVVLPELGGGVALRLEQLARSSRRGAAGPARAGHADLGVAGAETALPVMNDERPAVQLCSA
jgi:hypothetical protein